MSLLPIAGKPLDFTAWAKTAPARGAAGSAWESAILGLAESGDARFITILRGHIQAGVIRSERARAAITPAAVDAAA